MKPIETIRVMLGLMLWGVVGPGVVACATGPYSTPPRRVLGPGKEAKTARVDGDRGGESILMAWIPELLKRREDRPSWTTYEVDGRVSFRGPPGLIAGQTEYDDQGGLTVEYSNADIRVWIVVGVEAGCGGVAGVLRNTRMGDRAALIGVESWGGNILSACTVSVEGLPDGAVHVFFARGKSMRRTAAQEAVDIVRSIHIYGQRH